MRKTYILMVAKFLLTGTMKCCPALGGEETEEGSEEEDCEGGGLEGELWSTEGEETQSEDEQGEDVEGEDSEEGTKQYTRVISEFFRLGVLVLMTVLCWRPEMKEVEEHTM
eukprot:gnl/MRDRNA2_/MRDRNA2_320877_c0_seq1.p2 gnl/MRDRNA2_/MRDRNA2_320877_c0~~gnl/MRDRNA2_/MRDRNA2_320877_c0_seq1.p2  ORF type:complete len:111 (-),score=21.14 gnl/MRDRNA2_/MRDRNA2_320877_c0_seq1:198-530(-)